MSKDATAADKLLIPVLSFIPVLALAFFVISVNEEHRRPERAAEMRYRAALGTIAWGCIMALALAAHFGLPKSSKASSAVPGPGLSSAAEVPLIRTVEVPVVKTVEVPKFVSVPFDPPVGSPLTGVRSVILSVDITCDQKLDGQAFAIIKDQITTDVRLRLAQAGIRLSEESDPTAPELHVDIVAMRLDGIPITVYACSTKLRDLAARTLIRDTHSSTATLWESTPMVGSIGSSKVGDLRVTADDTFNKFLADWYQANLQANDSK